MLNSLLNLVKEQAGDAILKNSAIPDNRQNEVVNEAANSIQGGFENLLSQGNISDVLKLFSGQTTAQNNLSQQFSGNLVQNLMGKFGMDNKAASGLAGSLIPAVLGSLVKRTNDPNDNAFNIQDLFNDFSGGKTSGFNVQSLLSKVQNGALDLDGDGDTDLQDIMLLLSGGKGGGGGLMDTIKGIFSK